MKRANETIRGVILLTALAILASGCGGSKPLTGMTAHELFAEGKAKYDGKKYFKAIEYFQAVVYNYPGESIVDTAQYYLSLAYYGNEDYALAQVEFNRLALNYPSSVYFESAMLLRAVCSFESAPGHYGLDQTEAEDAIKMLEDFIVDFPESQYLPDAKKYLLVARTRMARKLFSAAVVYARIDDYDAAEVYYQAVIDNYTDTEYGAKATFGYAECELARKNYDEANTRFESFRTVFPDNPLTGKALTMAAKAAFKGCELAVRKPDSQSAREKLQRYIDTYRDVDKGKFKKASQYLEELNKTGSGQPQVENAESQDRDSVGDPGRNL